MNDRVMQFRVGVVVLATMIIGALLVTLNSPVPEDWVPWVQSEYQVTIDLERAPGIGPDTPVRKNGILIGRVAEVNDLGDRVGVVVDVEKKHKLYPEYDAEVRTSVLGDATIEFVTSPVPPDAVALKDGAVVNGKVLGNPLDMLTNLEGDLKRTIDSLGRAGDEVAKLAERVDHAFGDQTRPGRVTGMLDQTEVMIQDFTRAATAVEQFFEDPGLRQASQEASATMRDMRAAAKDVRIAARSAQTNLHNLEGFTEPLGRRGEQIASALVEGLHGMGRIVEELTVLTTAVNNRQGTIGQLIHNPAVYDSLDRLLCNANQVVLRFYEIETRLRIVVEDARVFMDKIAREPGRLIGGALNKGPGLK